MESVFNQVVVIGVGGVGWPLVVSLCQVLDGSPPVIIYDDDNFEGGNGYQRFPYVFNPKILKIDWLRGHIETIWRKKPPMVFPRRIKVADFKDKDWSKILLVDCTDADPKDRKKLHDAALKSGATYMRVSYDGFVGTVARGLPMLAREAQEGPGGYIDPPDLPMSFAVGGWGAKFVLKALISGEVEEGMLRVPSTKEKPDGVAQTTGGLLPDGGRVDGGGDDGGVGDRGDGGGSKGKKRVDRSVPRRSGRKVD